MFEPDKNDGGGKPYDLTEEEWEAMTHEQKQDYFDMFRARVYTYWFRNAQHKREEAERREAQKSRFRVDDDLE